MKRSPVVLALVLALLTTCRGGQDHSVDPERRADVLEDPSSLELEVSPSPDAGADEAPADVEVSSTEAGSNRPTATGEDEPMPVGGDVEPPRLLDGSIRIEELTDMMQSGQYAWGSCLFQVTITKRGKVADVEFLKPADLATEVRTVIEGAARGWRFSPAMLRGEPVVVNYILVIHHCPLYRKDSEES